MIPSVFVRGPYQYDADAASDESGLKCLDKTLAKQAFKEECDINTIVERFGLTGELPEGVHAPTYGDFTEVYDFHSAANALARARESFELMPAAVRARFQNDPARFVDFCSDEANRDEARKLGLLVPEKAVTATSDGAGAVAAAGGATPPAPPAAGAVVAAPAASEPAK